MKKTLLFTSLTILLTACVDMPPQTLDQKLAGATSAKDRKEVLRLACLNEAEVVNGKSYPFKAPSRGHSAPRTPQEVYKAKALCRKLDTLGTDQGEDTPQIRAALSGECSTMLKTYAEKYPSDKQHVEAMTRLCREMTE